MYHYNNHCVAHALGNKPALPSMQYFFTSESFRMLHRISRLVVLKPVVASVRLWLSGAFTVSFPDGTQWHFSDRLADLIVGFRVLSQLLCGEMPAVHSSFCRVYVPVEDEEDGNLFDLADLLVCYEKLNKHYEMFRERMIRQKFAGGRYLDLWVDEWESNFEYLARVTYYFLDQRYIKSSYKQPNIL